jgi:hypothetical protein
MSGREKMVPKRDVLPADAHPPLESPGVVYFLIGNHGLDADTDGYGKIWI